MCGIFGTIKPSFESQVEIPFLNANSSRGSFVRGELAIPLPYQENLKINKYITFEHITEPLIHKHSVSEQPYYWCVHLRAPTSFLSDINYRYYSHPFQDTFVYQNKIKTLFLAHNGILDDIEVFEKQYNIKQKVDSEWLLFFLKKEIESLINFSNSAPITEIFESAWEKVFSRPDLKGTFGCYFILAPYLYISRSDVTLYKNNRTGEFSSIPIKNNLTDWELIEEGVLYRLNLNELDKPFEPVRQVPPKQNKKFFFPKFLKI